MTNFEVNMTTLTRLIIQLKCTSLFNFMLIQPFYWLFYSAIISGFNLVSNKMIWALSLLCIFNFCPFLFKQQCVSCLFFQVWSLTSTSRWSERRASRRLYNLKCSGSRAISGRSLHQVIKCLSVEHLLGVICMVELAFTHLGYFLKVASKKLIFVFLAFLFFFWCCSFCVETCFCGIPMLKLVF